MSETTIDRLQIEVSALSTDAQASLEKLKNTMAGLKSIVHGGLNFESFSEELKKTTNESERAITSLDKLYNSIQKFKGGAKFALFEKLRSRIGNVNNLQKKINVAPAMQHFNTVENSSPAPVLESINKSLSGGAPLSGSSIPAQYALDLIRINDELGEMLEKQERLKDADFTSRVSQLRAGVNDAFNMGGNLNNMVLGNLRAMLDQLREYTPTMQEAGKASKVTEQSVNDTARSFENLRKVLAGAFVGADKLRAMFGRLLALRGLRSIIMGVSKGFSEGMTNLLAYGRALNTDFASAIQAGKSSLLELKNGIAAAVSPIITALAPAFATLAQWIITAVNALNQFFALLTGASSWTRPKAVSAGISGVGGAAKKADKELKGLLADWDELNIIQSESEDSAGGGGGAGGGGASMFEQAEFDPKLKAMLEWVKDHLDLIKAAALGVGAAFFTWGLSRGLGLGLKDALKYTVGIGLAVFGVAYAVQGLIDQFKNGVNWDNLKQSVIGVGVAVAGLGIVAGLTGMAWGLLAGGVLLIINPLKEFIQTQEMTTESLTQFSIGIGAVALGLSILTGSILPAAFAAIGLGVAWAIEPLKELSETGSLTDESLTKLSASIGAIGLGLSILAGSWIPLAIAAVAVGIAWVVQKWDWLRENVFDPVAGWIDEKIVQPVKKGWEDAKATLAEVAAWFAIKILTLRLKFSDLGLKIKTAFSDALTKVKETWDAVGAWFTENVVTPIEQAFAPVVGWIDENVIQPIVKLWENVTAPIKALIDEVKHWLGIAEEEQTHWDFSGTYDEPIGPQPPPDWNTETMKNDAAPVIEAQAAEAVQAAETAKAEVEKAYSELNSALVYEAPKNNLPSYGDSIGAEIEQETEPALSAIENAGEEITSAWDELRAKLESYDPAKISPYFEWKGGLQEQVESLLRESGVAEWDVAKLANEFYQAWDAALYGENWAGSTEDLLKILQDAIETAVPDALPTIDTSAFESGLQNTVASVTNSVNEIKRQIASLNGLSVGGGFSVTGTSSLKRNIPKVTGVSYSLAAAGGEFDTGEFFVARESGPELVGTIGRRTAVANNEHIEEGISSGVRDANGEVVEVLRDLYAVNRRILAKTGKVTLSPSAALGRTVKRSEEMRLVNDGV